MAKVIQKTTCDRCQKPTSKSEDDYNTFLNWTEEKWAFNLCGDCRTAVLDFITKREVKKNGNIRSKTR